MEYIGDNVKLVSKAKENFIAQQMGNKIMAAYQKDNNKSKLNSPIEVVTYLAQASRPYLQWLVNRYVACEFKLEDINRLKNDLLKFNLIKNKVSPQQRDINRMSLRDLYQVLAPFENKEMVSNKQADRKFKQQLFDNKEATLVYKDSQITVVVPHTKKASCYFGKNTKWCTAAKKDNKFDDYHDSGFLYIIMTHNGHKYQFHFEENQFMDELDQEVDIDELTKKYPSLFNAFNDIAKKQLFLPFIKDQTLEICMAAVKQDGCAIQYVKEQTPELWINAVKQDGSAIQYVKEQTLELCMIAVKQNGWALRYVKEQTLEICMAAVKKDGCAIQFVKEQTPELCMIAVKNDSWAFPYIKEQTPELCMAAVKKNSWALRDVKLQTPELCMIAVKNDSWVLQYVKEQTPEICMAAVKNSSYALQYVKEQTLEICMAVVKKERVMLDVIKDPELKQQIKRKLNL